ncbi:hypothetical protein bsdtw1_03991 [Clostridium fungisolvens]|uniref:Uncharacterized protein n=1 Tax=Clostridium fungisolvens TaxID=1604897 RepID=A0A6V8SKR1_9CLOT|nr:hypothetical protein bsdtw1_03991 [Clostridium fungisolvens]
MNKYSSQSGNIDKTSIMFDIIVITICVIGMIIAIFQ